MSETEQFDTFQEAFDYCRNLDKPVLVRVEDEIGTVFPSGCFRPSQSREVPHD